MRAAPGAEGLGSAPSVRSEVFPGLDDPDDDLVSSLERRQNIHPTFGHTQYQTYSHSTTAAQIQSGPHCFAQRCLILVTQQVPSHPPRASDVCPSTVRDTVQYLQNTRHDAKGVRSPHTPQAACHFCYPQPRSQLQLESRATLSCFAQRCLTLLAQRVVSDV